MIEILWHGRGGQGAFTAARLLGAASALAEGRFALAFPSFGPERRGAPMRAFTKMDTSPIGDRSAVSMADFVVYLDETLLDLTPAADGEPACFAELKPGGRILVNSTRSFADPRIAAIDADGISKAILGRPIPNTALLGGIAALCDIVDEEGVCEAIRQYMPAKLHQGNIAIVHEASAQVAAANSGSSATSAAAAQGVTPAAPQTAAPAAAETAAETADPAAAADDRAGGPYGAPAAPADAAPRRRNIRIPSLRHDDLDPADYARSTCFSAGYLVAVNAGWRNERPVLDEAACTGCLKCYMECPDGAVFKPAAPEPPASAGQPAREACAVAIDYDFCKGCGICVAACKFDALSMIPESEANAR